MRSTIREYADFSGLSMCQELRDGAHGRRMNQLTPMRLSGER